LLKRPKKTARLNKVARFEIHFEKLQNRVEGAGADPFEARLESVVSCGRDGIHWSSRDLVSSVLKRAAALFAEALMSDIYLESLTCFSTQTLWRHPRQPNATRCRLQNDRRSAPA
jgi:hypothetical protein